MFYRARLTGVRDVAAFSSKFLICKLIPAMAVWLIRSQV